MADIFEFRLVRESVENAWESSVEQLNRYIDESITVQFDEYKLVIDRNESILLGNEKMPFGRTRCNPHEKLLIEIYIDYIYSKFNEIFREEDFEDIKNNNYGGKFHIIFSSLSKDIIVNICVQHIIVHELIHAWQRTHLIPYVENLPGGINDTREFVCDIIANSFIYEKYKRIEERNLSDLMMLWKRVSYDSRNDSTICEYVNQYIGNKYDKTIDFDAALFCLFENEEEKSLAYLLTHKLPIYSSQSFLDSYADWWKSRMASL